MSSIEEATSILANRYKDSYAAREARAEADQRQIARQNQRTKHVKGLGGLKMEIPASVAKDWMHKEGKDVLRDPDWQRYMKRNNPHMFVEQEKRGNRVGYGS